MADIRMFEDGRLETPREPGLQQSYLPIPALNRAAMTTTKFVGEAPVMAIAVNTPRAAKHLGYTVRRIKQAPAKELATMALKGNALYHLASEYAATRRDLANRMFGDSDWLNVNRSK